MKHFEILIIGSGPAGQEAALQSARFKKKTAIIEKERNLGGACVHHGTIPSKTLRENALQLQGLKRHAETFQFSLKEDLEVSTMMKNLDEMLDKHVHHMTDQLMKAGVETIHGRAKFVSPQVVEVQGVSGQVEQYSADAIMIATGSRPLRPHSIEIDHENIFDSDSVLSLIYLPRTMTVLGGGVIACEYASIFAALGCKVTIIDHGPKPMPFLDDALIEEFVREFEQMGGRYMCDQRPRKVRLNDMGHVVTDLGDGQSLVSEKMLVAMGRKANLESLDLHKVELGLTIGGHLEVDHYCRTPVSNIYAIGDVAGPPALASSAMEQGRRAVMHASGVDPGNPLENIPVGVYAIPELATIGLTESEALERYSDVATGISRFCDLPRGQISGIRDGFLKLVCRASTRQVLGVQIAGEGAAELIHIGELTIKNKGTADDLLDDVFNYPTFAEAYRVAAQSLSIVE